MVSLTQFKIKFKKEFSIEGEYEGDKNSKKCVIFSHGFGVKRDSRGMFTQLSESLKDRFLTVRFDYNGILQNKNATRVYSLSTQAKVLRKVIQFVRNEVGILQVNIIAHSMGCLVVGILSPKNINKIILLASPQVSPYQRMKEYFSKRPETKFDEKDLSKVKRSDGSWTFINADFWQEVKEVDPVRIFRILAQKSEVYFIKAKSDEVITDKDYRSIKRIPKLEYLELEGSHNFDGEARKPLLREVVGILSN